MCVAGFFFFLFVVGGYQLGASTIDDCFVWCSTELKPHNAMTLQSTACTACSQA